MRHAKRIASSLALLSMTSLTSCAQPIVDRDELMTRIAVGGFLHETNTFAPTKATYDDFVHGGGWPRDGAGRRCARRSCATSMSGWPALSKQAEAEGWELVPTISCGASPSAHVTEDAFERIAKVMVDGITAAGQLDAVYLDLHGAMVTEHLDDGEGEILARVRKVIGKDTAAGGQPRSARQCDARDGGACGCADRLPHLSACRHGRHRPRRAETSGAAAEYEAASCKSVPAIAVPDSDQLAMHQRPADQGHLPEAGRAAERGGADAVLCAGFSGGRFCPLRAERVRLWPDAGRCRRRGRHASRR